MKSVKKPTKKKSVDFPLINGIKNIIDPNIIMVVDMKHNYDKPRLIKVINKKTKEVLFDTELKEGV